MAPPNSATLLVVPTATPTNAAELVALFRADDEAGVEFEVPPELTRRGPGRPREIQNPQAWRMVNEADELAEFDKYVKEQSLSRREAVREAMRLYLAHHRGA